jgi:3-dehydroquinate dehydratase
MRFSFLKKPAPVITGIFSGQNPQELIAQSRASEFEGAGGIAIDLNHLKPEFHNCDSLKSVIDSVDLPFMFYYYRGIERDDDVRQKLLLTAAEAGAAMIDVMGDLYDPSPREITHNPEAIDKQKRLIDQIHAKGAEVVISSHLPSEFRTTEQVLEHMLDVQSRGADVVKIVTNVNTDEELAEAFKTTMALKRELNVPFIHLCGGKFSRPHRFMGPALGVSIVFGVPYYHSVYSFPQPLIRSIKAVLDNIHWNINDVG